MQYEEGPASLHPSAAEKATKYLDLTEQIQKLTGAEQVTYFDFPLGARGNWHTDNW